jgi:hypothetical protein
MAPQPEYVMLDLWYVGGTVIFFAAMLGYLAACQRLGKGSESTEQTQ